MDERLEQVLAESRRRVRVLERELAQCHDKVSALRSSSSWRITAPLHLASLGLRTLKSILLKSLHQWSATRAIARSGLFDRNWYLVNNPDVAQSGLDPIKHYVRYGAREGRDPSPSFSTQGYVSNYLDVARAGINPLEHFILRGAQEGRIAMGWLESRNSSQDENGSAREPTI